MVDTALTSYANPGVFHDPKPTSKHFLRQCRQQSGTNRQHMVAGLAIQSKYHYSGVEMWRIPSDISKMRIHRHYGSTLTKASGCDDCIRRAADFLVEDRHCIMPRLDEKPRQLAGQVFIEF